MDCMERLSDCVDSSMSCTDLLSGCKEARLVISAPHMVCHRYSLALARIGVQHLREL